MSEQNLTKESREEGDGLFTGFLSIFRIPIRKIDSISPEKASSLIGTLRGTALGPESGAPVERLTLTLTKDGIWKLIIVDLLVEPPEVDKPDGGRWILRRNRIELWHADLGAPADIESPIVSIHGRWYFIAAIAKDGLIALTKIK